MLPSPYTPGSVPLVLAGRDAQLDQIRDQLGGVSTYARFVGRIRVETGPRGLGKTSLLKAIADTAAEAGFVTTWVTARADESLAGQLAHALAESLAGIGVQVGSDRGLRDRIRSLRVEVGGGPAKAGVEFDVDRPDSTRPAAAALGDLVVAGADRARRRGSAGLCLLVDEIQAAPSVDLRTVAYAWQELQVRHDQPAAAMYAAGLPNAPDALTDAVTFSERFAFRALGRLTDAEAADALVRTAAVAGVSWEGGVVEEVAALAQGYPYFVQLYGDAIWQVAAPETGGVLTHAHLEAAHPVVDADTQTMFRSRWAKASPGEQRLLAGMAALGDGPVRRAELAAYLGIATTDLSVQRRRLIDKGLVEAAGHGRLRFTTPGFAAFVREESGLGPPADHPPGDPPGATTR